jgi:adenosyl cobinamide kinase/adenosyl cobinamide phosphate guanylyltransferase
MAAKIDRLQIKGADYSQFLRFESNAAEFAVDECVLLIVLWLVGFGLRATHNSITTYRARAFYPDQQVVEKTESVHLILLGLVHTKG